MLSILAHCPVQLHLLCIPGAHEHILHSQRALLGLTDEEESMAHSIVGLLKRYRADGSYVWHIDKRVKRYGRLCESTDTGDREEAERYLIHRLRELREIRVYGERPQRTFRDAVQKYLAENSAKKSIDRDAVALRDLDSFIGNLPLDRINNDSFAGSVWTGSFPRRKLSCGQPFVLGSSITIADGPIWGWVRGFPLPRQSRLPDRLRAIAAENPTSCAPIRSSEDSITSTHWRPRDPFSGFDSNFCGSQPQSLRSPPLRCREQPTAAASDTVCQRTTHRGLTDGI